MGALFAEAQSTAKKIVIEARLAADKLVNDAKAESERLVKEAEIKAETAEKEAGKNAESVMKAASRLKDIFEVEMKTLSSKLSEAAKEAEGIGKRLGEEIEETRSNISENVQNFLDGDSEVNTILNDYMISSEKQNDENSESELTDNILKQSNLSDDNEFANNDDDILSSFAIDPVNDNEEDKSLSKKQPTLGFDLEDLAKLAEEAEKDM